MFFGVQYIEEGSLIIFVVFQIFVFGFQCFMVQGYVVVVVVEGVVRWWVGGVLGDWWIMESLGMEWELGIWWGFIYLDKGEQLSLMKIDF